MISLRVIQYTFGCGRKKTQTGNKEIRKNLLQYLLHQKSGGSLFSCSVFYNIKIYIKNNITSPAYRHRYCTAFNINKLYQR